MLNTMKVLLASQYEAALCTLHTCVVRCPDDAWGMRIGTYKFGQVVFHTLFFADYYVGTNHDALRIQPFHRQHADTFADYEELEDRPPQALHPRSFIIEYLEHCRTKAAAVIAAETAESLGAKADFVRRDFSRAELHVCNIRHIQHHSAQLSLRLRVDRHVDIPWFGSGWRDV